MDHRLAALPVFLGRSIGRFLGYAFLPNFERTLKPMGETYYNFGRILSLVFGSIGLIDRSHPWRRQQARPRPMEVLAYACARANWRTPLAVPTVLTAAITLLLTCGLVGMTGMGVGLTLGAGQAYANSMFGAPNPGTDLALRYMSNSFGIPIPGVPQATVDGVVQGFQNVMGLYSMAMLVIAGFILLYIILGVIASTAHEGRFGGSGFNQVWAPIRLVVAIGLLVPISNGYNSGQYIVMKIAEIGSGMASNLWVPFATSLAERRKLLNTPMIESASTAVRGVLINEFCMARHNLYARELTGVPIVERITDNSGRMTYVYYTHTESPTKRYCGVVNYERAADPGLLNGMLTGATFSFISNNILQAYNDAYGPMRLRVEQLAQDLTQPQYFDPHLDAPGMGVEENIDRKLLDDLVPIIRDYQNALAAAMATVQNSQNTAATNALSREVRDSGWAGAPMWFNTIARMNADVMSVSRALPTSTMPDYESTEDDSTSGIPKISNNVKEATNALLRRIDKLRETAVVLGYNTNAGSGNISGVATSSVFAGFDPPNPVTGKLGDASRIIGDVLNFVFSGEVGGPFAYINRGVNAQLSQTNPLAELASIGDWMLNKSMFLISIAFLTTSATGIPLIGKLISGASYGISMLLFLLGAMGFGVGVLLFYVTPLMPFIRFLFGIAGWLLNVLEAVVAIPLLAIAHLNTNESGISGSMARTGYMMVFSIFLRPALLIVGMIAALMMFTVGVGILNDMYKSAVLGFRSGTTGEANGGLSIIMYTILYCVIAFGLCNLCFKLIEEIPNRAMIWIGQSAAKEIRQDEDVAKALSGAGDTFIAMPAQLAQRRLTMMKSR